MNEQLCKCGHYGHRQRDNSCRVTTCDCTSFRPAEPEQAASDDLLAAAKEFMLARHRLYFQRLENLTVGSNFIHSAAEFAAQRTAELEKRVEELDDRCDRLEVVAYIAREIDEYWAGGNFSRDLFMAPLRGALRKLKNPRIKPLSQAKED